MMEDLTRAKRTAIYFLSSRMYTCKEIFDKLRRKGYEEEVAEAVVEELIKAGYLNDARYAEMYIIDSVNLGAKGMYRIRQELLRKGIARDVVENAAADAEVSTEDSLREYLNGRLRSGEITTWKEYERLRAQLARRGYSLGEINRVLREYEFELERD